MGIKTNTRDVASLGENIKNISGIGGIVPDTLLGLAETLENRIAIDATTAQFFENIKKGLNINQQISDLQLKITDDTKKIKRPSPLPTLLGVIPTRFDIGMGDVSSLANTITSLERAEQDKTALNNAIEDNNDAIRNNKGNGTVQEEARNKASNNKQIINYDIREADRIIPLLRDLKELQTFKKNYGAILANRRTEFSDMKSLADKFYPDGDFQAKNTALNPTKDLTNFKYKDTLGSNIPLQEVFFGTNTPENPEYAICDVNTGKKIENDGGYQLSINGKDVKVKGLTIHNSNELKIDKLEIDPIQDIKFPVTIKFGIRGSQQKSGVHLDMFKNITISLQTPEMDCNRRQTNYDIYNNTNTISDRIESAYNNKHEERENEFIRELLRTNGNEAEVNKIYENETLRKELIDRIRANPGVTFPMLDIGSLQTEFKNKITDDSEASKVPLQYLVSDNAFIDYLRNNIAKNVEDFLKKKVKKDVDGNMALRNNILTTFTKFDTTLSKTLGDDPSVRTNAESTLVGIQTNGRKRIDNYMKFFVGKSSSIKDQGLELNDKNHKYSVDVSCETMGKLVAKIDVDGQNIELAGRNIRELLRAIVSSGRISSNKVAVHIAFGTMKAMIKLMQEKNMNMSVRNGRGNIVETRFKDEKLSINEVDNSGRIVSKIFDEEHFHNLKDFNTLNIALGQLVGDFHRTMHYYNEDYKRATQYTRVNRLMKYDPRGTRGFRRIRKIWNWKKKNTLDFEFPPTSIKSGDKTVNISFEKGKFNLSVGEKEYTTNNIGGLLKKNREFDGMQTEIISAINSKYVEMLRANARVQKTNFGVYDNAIGRLYIIDSNGSLNYVNGSRSLISGRTQGKGYGKILDRNMPNSMIPVTSESEVAQFWQNPLLGGKIVKSMMRRLGGI